MLKCGEKSVEFAAALKFTCSRGEVSYSTCWTALEEKLKFRQSLVRFSQDCFNLKQHFLAFWSSVRQGGSGYPLHVDKIFVGLMVLVMVTSQE